MPLSGLLDLFSHNIIKGTIGIFPKGRSWEKELSEARAHWKESDKAMLDELTRWLNLGAFERLPRKHGTNVIDGGQRQAHHPSASGRARF